MSRTREFLDNLTHEQLLGRLNLALDGGGLGIWDWDLRDDSVQFDHRWCEMLGLEHATTSMELATWSERVHPDDLDACHRDIRAHLEGRTERYENVHRMRHADGRWIYILDRGRISGRDVDGRPIRFTGTHLDVTVTERARRVLQREQEQLERLVANLPTGVAMFDRAGRLLAMSPGWCELHRVEAEELRGHTLAEAAPALAGRWGAALDDAIGGRRRGAEEEPVVIDGETRWLRWELRPWRNVDGAIGGALHTVEDVSTWVRERHELEREREARLASLAIFAGGVAHELNSPLQVITFELEIMGRELLRPQPDLAELGRSVGSVVTTVRRAASITHALRTLSRDASHDPTAPVPVRTLLADVGALCRRRCEGGGVELVIDDRTGGAEVEGRSAELLAALVNLVHNAHDAAREGQPWIRLEVERRGEAVVFRCVDGGPGIAPEHARRMMEPFFTTKPVGVGTGLGLTLAQAMAVRNRGYLRHMAGEAHTTFELGVPRAGWMDPVAP